jgi:hypothetical protein
MLEQTLVVLLYVWGHLDRVKRSAAALLLYVRREPQSLGPAARVGPLIAPIYKLRFLLMVATVEQLGPDEVRLADCALEGDEMRPDLPVDILPLHLLLVVHELDEPVQVKEAVGHVLGDNLPMKVDEDFGVRAHHPLVLLAGVHLSTINAPVEQSRALALTFRAVDQGLQFLHEKLACELVPLVQEVI